MTTILDLAINSSIKDVISGQIKSAIEEFKKLKDVSDDTKKSLNDFSNIKLTSDAMIKDSKAWLQFTVDTLKDCVNEAGNFEESMSNLMNKSFGQKLIDPIYKDDIVKVKKDFSDMAMQIGINTKFDSKSIVDSMTALVGGGVEVKDVINGTAKANAYFAQVNKVTAESTAESTAKMKIGFGIAGDEVINVMDCVNQFANATKTNSIDIQKALGDIAETANTVWKGRDKKDITSETTALTSLTIKSTGDTANSANFVKDFFVKANTEISKMSASQAGAMQKADWIDSSGHSIFIDYEKGMLKDIYQIEEILENAKKSMGDAEFAYVLDSVFQDGSKKVAEGLADFEGSLDLSTLNSIGSLNIATQVEMEMNKFNEVKNTFAESWGNFKKVIGEPFLNSAKDVFNGLAQAIQNVTKYFSNHPEIAKFMGVIAGGVSTFLLIVGSIMSVTSVVGTLKTVMEKVGSKIIGSMGSVLPVFGKVFLVMGAIALIAYTIYKNWDTLSPYFSSIANSVLIILEKLKSGFDTIMGTIKPIIMSVWDCMSAWATLIVTIVVPIISRALKSIVDFLNGPFKIVWNIVSGILGVIIDLLSGDFKSAWDTISEALGVVVDLLNGGLNIAFDGIFEVLIIIADLLNGGFKIAWDIILGVLTIIGDLLLGDFKSAWDITSEALATITDLLNGSFKIAWDSTLGGLESISDFLFGGFKSAWDSMSPLAKTFLAIFGPSILSVTAYLIFLKVAAIASAVAMGIHGIAIGVVSKATAIWKGIMLAAAFVQQVWNIAMKGGTLATVGQKIAYAALLPIILLVKGATLLWSFIQGALNAAFLACPVVWVIVGIIALIAAVVLVVTHFKEIVEWVGKAWDKLKEFLGFKKDAKDELEKPISTSVESSETKRYKSINDTSGFDFNNILSQFKSEDKYNINAPQQDYSKILNANPSEMQKVYSYDVNFMPEYSNFNEADLFNSKNFGNYSDLSNIEFDNVKDLENTKLPWDTNNSEMDKFMKNLNNDNSNINLGLDDTNLMSQIKNMSNGVNQDDLKSSLNVSDIFNNDKTKDDLVKSTETINTTITDTLISDDEMNKYGSNLIQSYIDGMDSKKLLIEESVKNIAGIMGDYLRVMSPTKKGALSTNNLWGHNLMKSISEGIYNNLDLVKNATKITSIETDKQKYSIQNSANVNSRNNSQPAVINVYATPAQSPKQIAEYVASIINKGINRKTNNYSSLTMSPNGYKGGY